MIVVADTTPLNYLILIDHIDILEKLFSRRLIPHAVHDELMDVNAPTGVRSWGMSPPVWLEVLSPSGNAGILALNLDRGESEAIHLAQELHSDWLLIDEAAGREEARRRGLRTIGTLGILRNSHGLRLLDLDEALTRLRKTGFHVSERVLRALRESV
jgi:predicted nucleic acid-binding protein